MSRIALFFRNTVVQTVAMVLVCVLLVIGSAVSFAWLADYLASGDLGFRAGELDGMQLQLARVPHSADEEADESARSYTLVEDYRIEKNEDDTHLEITLANMTFGSIDNVAQLKPENIVYLRLTVPKANGNTVDISMYYLVEEFISLYAPSAFDDQGNVVDVEQVTDETHMKSIYAVEEEAGDAFISFTAVASNEDIAADDLAAQLDFTSATSLSFSVLSEETTETLTVSNASYDELEDDESFYVYIRVTPNLGVFAHAIEYIADLMPCNMFFRIGASFEAHYIETTAEEGGDNS